MPEQSPSNSRKPFIGRVQEILSLNMLFCGDTDAPKQTVAPGANPVAAADLQAQAAGYEAQGSSDLAIACLKRALGFDPQSASIHRDLGRLHLDQGHTIDALAAFNQAVALDPEDAASHYGLGRVLQELSRREEAVAAYQQALSLGCRETGLYGRLGDVCRDLDRFDEAVVAYQQAFALAPPCASLYLGLASAYWGMGRHKDAVTAFEQAVALNPKHAKAHVSLAAAYLKTGNPVGYRAQIALARPLMAGENRYDRASFAAICGHLEETLLLLRPEFARDPGLRRTARRDPDFDFLCDEIQFQALVREP